MDELISIIVPVYNIESYLRKCLDSIREQAYQNLEIILIDDGSTDNSGKICDEYREKDSRIVVIHQKNQGALSARNTGIEHASGQYIGFVDGDDWLSGQMYQDLYRSLKIQDAEMAVCKKNIYDDNTKICFAESDILAEGYYAECRHADILQNLLGCQTGMGVSLNLYDKLFSRRLILQNYKKVDLRLRYFEDMALALFCMMQADGIVISNQPHYFYRQRKGSLCHSIDRLYLEQLNIFYYTVHLQVAKYSKELLDRLDMYIADRAIYGLNHMMGIGLKNEIPYFVPPFKQLEYGDRVVLYGAGNVGKSYHCIFELTRPGQVVLWVDRQYERLWREGFRVQGIETLSDMEFDKLVIAVMFRESAEGIKTDLLAMGIPPEKIIWEQPTTLISG